MKEKSPTMLIYHQSSKDNFDNIFKKDEINRGASVGNLSAAI